MDLRHSRPFRITLLLAFALTLLLGVGPYFFDAEYARNELRALVFRETGRMLSIQGTTHVVLLPSPGLIAEDVTLSETDAITRFAHADRVRIQLSPWALLRRHQVSITRLEVDRPELSIRRIADGRYNFDDLLSSRGAHAELRFDLQALEFTDGRFDYADTTTGDAVSLSNLKLLVDHPTDPKEGALKLSGDFALAQNGSVRWRSHTEAGAALRYIAAERRLYVAGLTLNMTQQGKSGDSLGVAHAQLDATGELVYGWEPLRLNGGSLKVKAVGTRAQQAWQWTVDAPRIDFRNGVARLNDLKFALDIRSPQSRIEAEVDVPALAGTQRGSLRADAAKLDVKLSSPEQTFTLNFASPLELHQGTLARLPNYRLTGTYTNKGLPRGAIPFELSGEAKMDLQQETISLDNRGTLDGAEFATLFSVSNFVNPSYRLNLDLARLDLTPYLPAVAEGAKAVDTETPFEFGWLQQLDAEGQLHIGEFVVKNLHLQNIALQFMANDGKVRLDPLSAHIYGGELSGQMEIDASGDVPSFHVRQLLSDVNVNPLMNDLLATSRFEGRGQLDLDVSARGSRLSEIRGSANGRARMSLARGLIRGMDLEALLRTANQQLKLMNGEQVSPADMKASTHFSELHASLAIKDGIANNRDLYVGTGLLRLDGGGQIDLGRGSIDYTMRASANPRVPELRDIVGLTVPIRLTGSLASPEYRIDYSTLREQLEARQKAATKAPAKPAAAKPSPPASGAKPPRKLPTPTPARK
ncbi:AsmA family protein [Chitiniphilus eburneus]|uniref:AsmA family protein n=1 Tax=Chitiniphilus eburneus TaxID=2571148 RepID=A0A4U0Q1E0_9NEIS|nr:AsmA family protein [Chitiniphilus eburneus]TJZ74826.1 AsmA family protein [Chitiniphilus eburneus]